MVMGMLRVGMPGRAEIATATVIELEIEVVMRVRIKITHRIRDVELAALVPMSLLLLTNPIKKTTNNRPNNRSNSRSSSSTVHLEQIQEEKTRGKKEPSSPNQINPSSSQ